MNFFANKKSLLSFGFKPESSGVPKPRIFSLSEISTLDPLVLKTIPKNIKELGNLSKPLEAEGLVISEQLVQDFWTNNNLDKKIKKIITPLSLHHPRAISSAAQAIQRLIMRQNLPESWKIKKQNKTARIVLYFSNSEIGSSEWLPEILASVSEQELGKALKQGLSALYSERFIRERLQRGWSQHHLPVSMVATVVNEVKQAQKLSIHTVHPSYNNSAIAQVTVTVKGQNHDYAIFKPAFHNKKSFLLNNWQNPILAEETLRTVLAPIFALEQKQEQTLHVSGIFNQASGLLTVLHLESDQHKNSEILYEYILSNKSEIISSGEFLGQGIAVGSLLVERSGQAFKNSSGNIIVAKKLSTISESVIAEAVGLILEEDVDTARLIAKTRHITLPILTGVKNATKKFRSGTMVTIAATLANEGAIYSGALPYEVKPIARAKHSTKTEIRPVHAAVTIDELIGQSKAQHPLQYFSKKKNSGKEYTQLLGQSLALTIAEHYPARLTVAFSNSLSRVFAHWPGGRQAENSLHLRTNARGAERYLAKRYEPVLAAECAAIQEVRERFGITNIDLQLPYCRSSVELEEMIAAIGKYGLTREKGWRFSLATDLPGHAILTSALAKHLDELVFDIDSLVKSTTGKRSTVITPVHQKTVEHALSAIAKAARKERARVALSGTLLATEPKLVWSAVKSGIKTLVVSAEEESVVRTAAWEAERTVGYGGANPKFLGMMASVACIGALLITVGAGCGRQDQAMTAPQMTPAQIRAEIMTALAEEKEKSLAEKTTATVSGFADFKVTYPIRYEPNYSPDNFSLNNRSGNDSIRFSVHSRYAEVASSTPFATNNNLPGKYYAFELNQEDSIVDLIPNYMYEVELEKNKILRIESVSSSQALLDIAKSVQISK